MTNPSLLIAMAVVMACTGCAGLKQIVQPNQEPAVAAPTPIEPQRACPTPVASKSRVTAAQPKQAEPRVIQGAPALLVTKSQENCLALNVYYEAGIEQEIGKMAIANVTINRLNTGRWGDNICDVVYADAQFSWTSAGKLPKPSGANWAESRKAAHQVILGQRIESLDKALYYHASYVKPYWKKPATKLRQIGKHIFYSGTKAAKTGAGVRVAQAAAAN